MKGFLIDLDGVVYQNQRLIPGAERTIAWLQTQQIPHLFVTNTSSKPRAAIVEKLAGMGIAVTEDRILAPPIAAADYLAKRTNGQPLLLVTPPTYADFAALTPASATQLAAVNAVVVGDLGQAWDFAQLNHAFQVLMANPTAELIALGMTRYWRTAQGLQLDVGPFVQALAYATGKTPVVMGKPSPVFFTQACQRLGLVPAQVSMIGDDAQSDVAAAQAVGMRGILVKTGKFQASDLQYTQPDFLLDSFADLPQLWV